MSLWDTIRVLIRRWSITVPGLLMACALAGIAVAVVPPSYESTGMAILVQPKLPNRNTSNPFLAFDPSLNTTAQILVSALNAPATVAAVGAVQGVDTFTVSDSDGQNAADYQAARPFLYVTVNSPSPRRSVSIVTGLLDQARQTLLDNQRTLGVTPQKYIRFQDLMTASAPKLVIKQTLLAGCVAFLVGLIGTLLVVFGRESYLADRAARRAAEMEAAYRVWRFAEGDRAVEALMSPPRGLLASGPRTALPAAPLDHDGHGRNGHGRNGHGGNGHGGNGHSGNGHSGMSAEHGIE
jgi:capsular polysaccharide biosynthesis protein